MFSRVRKTDLLVFVVSFFLLCTTFTLRIVGVADQYPEIVSMLFFCVMSVVVISSTCLKCDNVSEVIIILLAYILHIVVLLIDLYAKDYITIIHSGADSEGFYARSCKYYYGDFTIKSTYSLVLNGMYHIVGLNRFIVQYVNVIVWFGSMLVMLKCCEIIGVKKFFRCAALILLGFLPNYLCLTSILLRESLISFFTLFSFMFFLKWMKQRDNVNLFLAFIVSIPAIILHTATISIWASYFILLAFSSRRGKRIKFQKKTIFILALGVACVIVLFSVPLFRRMLLTYVPSLDEGILKALNNRFRVYYISAGDSSYLTTNIEINSYWELVLETIYRMIYFTISPTPAYWRGIGDILAFFFDSMFYLFTILLYVWSMLKKKKNVYSDTMFLTLIAFITFCAWGVSNAGTAMRHRDKVVGIAVLLFVYSLQLIKGEKQKLKMDREEKNANVV